LTKGDRPASIRWFVALFLLAALSAFVDGMRDLERTAVHLTERVPEVGYSHDATIIILSARLSIALIPTALIWFFASSVARWLATAFALGKLINLPEVTALVFAGDDVSPLFAVSLVAALASVAFLFTQGSRRYFSRREEPDLAAFD
jgi:hypothetical protein